MLTNVLLDVEATISIGTGVPILININRLAEGDYDIFCPQNLSQIHFRFTLDSIQIQFRFTSDSIYFKSPYFASSDEWTGFEAAHIFHMELWSLGGFGRPGRHSVNSVQNGLLLAAHMHRLFDSFLLSVNPDDDGRILDIVCRDPNNPDHVADEFLRWNFQQCVLANMKGAGEPIFEHNFPSGTDMMNEIICGPTPGSAHGARAVFSVATNPTRGR
ncbi:hypothetical protein ACN38_g8105 [Penicillium nordicum]|uniref:HNH nuclease domain-containing protein n=1 Tax=Penicillium nordicum TaxID=229535 RepID=A0A0M8P0H8_9EURO|nr:hypothetical protein ACN38_g8105 [Penicillium nordicum]